MADRSNVSADLIWECVREFSSNPEFLISSLLILIDLEILGSNNAFLVKRRSGGGVQFSLDPFNLVNKHTRTHAGFVNDKAVGIQDNGEGGIVLTTKKAKKSQNQPAASTNEVAWGKDKSSRK